MLLEVNSLMTPKAQMAGQTEDFESRNTRMDVHQSLGHIYSGNFLTQIQPTEVNNEKMPVTV